VPFSELSYSRNLLKSGSFYWAVRMAAATFALVAGTVANAQSPGEVPPSAHASLARFTTSSHAILANKGQVAEPVKFYLPGTRSTLFFTPSEIVLNIGPSHSDKSNGDDGEQRPDQAKGMGLVLRIGFEGAKLNPEVVGLDEQKGVSNVVQANAGMEESVKGIRRYAGVLYEDLYPGIDLECRASKDGLQRTLILKDGAKLNRVRFEYKGIEGTRLADDGRLELLTPLGVIVESPILVRYKKDTTGKGPIVASYKVQGSDAVGIEIGKAE